MAEPRLRVRNSAGAVVFDSVDATAGVCVGVVSVSSGVAQTLTYPSYPGRSARAVACLGTDTYGASTDTALGYPRVTLVAGVARDYAIFIL